MARRYRSLHFSAQLLFSPVNGEIAMDAFIETALFNMIGPSLGGKAHGDQYALP
ncbi:hypothetical protein RY831_21615 [Noviherbaspirillum sp. CPCC 100848]|uniref:Uncharacterized protein n=1 Tax=Noviherbaspirillum album TaxID=3080276 RepID=A0ABU6JDN8_9BURK|nr:hypothetical protein [Noviherbaspirillum sp. CPCC 100848]